MSWTWDSVQKEEYLRQQNQQVVTSSRGEPKSMERGHKRNNKIYFLQL